MAVSRYRYPVHHLILWYMHMYYTTELQLCTEFYYNTSVSVRRLRLYSKDVWHIRSCWYVYSSETMVVPVSYFFPGKYLCIYCFKTLDNLKSLLTSPAAARTVHNIKSDHHNFRRDGLQLKTKECKG